MELVSRIDRGFQKITSRLTSQMNSYTIMPFGLTNVPAVFQNLVNNVFRDMITKFDFMYLDDVLFY